VSRFRKTRSAVGSEKGVLREEDALT
jgi:hypothetical protein